MSRFADHFARVAADYAAHRPTYPEELFCWLASAAPACDLVWDCATGTGQAAVGLAGQFKQVWATDASASQIEAAAQAINITYQTAPADASGLPDSSADLVTVAQALHWFDLEPFYSSTAEPLGNLMLLDIQMPGMGGEEVLQRLRRQEQTSGEYLPAIALTAHALAGDREKLLGIGFNGYISKPVQMDHLLAEMARVLSVKGAVAA